MQTVGSRLTAAIMVIGDEMATSETRRWLSSAMVFMGWHTK